MSQISNKLVKVIKSSFRCKFCHEPGESASSRPSRGVGDSARTIEGRRITNIATGTFSGLTVALAIGSSLAFNNMDAYAEDSITVSISGNPSITVSPRSEGAFADSGNININVSNAPTNGYTLAIKSSGDTSLTGKTDSTKSISSIASAIDQNTFSTNSDYNNMWGYRPSMHYDSSDNQRTDNSNYLPSPDENGDIIDITNDSTANAYTLSIGARVTNSLSSQTYENSTFVITAVGNPSGVGCNSSRLCVQYDGNGLTFNDNTINRVNYDSGTRQETVTRIIHSDNVGDDGVATANSAVNTDQTKEATIEGADNVNVTLYYDTEGVSYDWVTLYSGADSVPTTANDAVKGSNGNLTGKLGGNKSGYTKTYTTWNIWNNSGNSIASDTIKVHFKTDATAGSYISYGYYAIVTGTSTVVDRVVDSGEYAVPAGSYTVFHGWSTARVPAGSGSPAQVEYSDEAAVMNSIPGGNGDTQTLYAVWQQGQPITFTMDSNVSSISVLDSDGNTVGNIVENGQGVVLVQGDTYTIKPTFTSGYTTDTITKTSGAGALSDDKFTTGSGSATINVTSKAKAAVPMQNYDCSNLANVGDTSTVYDARDGKEYLIGKLADKKCWMLDNLALDLTNSTVQNNLTASTTNASETTLEYLKNGGGTDPYASKKVQVKNKNGSGSWANSASAPYIVTGYEDDIPSDTISADGAYKIGVYYNFCAVSAGSYCYSDIDTTTAAKAVEDICPMGWHMPTGGNDGEFRLLGNAITGTTSGNYTGDNYTNFRKSLHQPFSGSFSGGSAQSQGVSGGFWSATRYNDDRMYTVNSNTTNTVYMTSTTVTYSGYSLRCVTGG